VRRPLLALALAGSLLGGFGAAADPAKPRGESGAEETAAVWETRLTDAQARLEQARGHAAASEQALARARHRRYPRGAAFDQLVADADDARKKLRAAEAELPELLEQARQAGVEPGVLRRFEPEE
jgi:hypothetical protein